MLKRYRSAAVGVAALLVTGSFAWAAGNWSTLPVIGGNSFCGSTVTGAGGLGGATGQGQASTGSICAQTIPAGPSAPTGVETIPVDTNTASGQPASAVMPTAMLGFNTRKNRLIGGDFATNLWQRGTTPVSAATPTTSVIGADRFAVYSSGNTVTVTKQTGAGDSVPTLGLYGSMRVNRPSGTDVTAITTGQVMEKAAASELIGNNAVCSFYAKAGAGFSAATSNLTVKAAYYTVADSATPLTNTDAFMKGTITGYVDAIGGVSPGTTGSIASGVATIPISTTWTRYAVWAPIPTANAAGTAVTGFGFTMGYVPVGTGGATDWFEVEGVQCQAMPSTATGNLPNGVISPTGFEKRPASEEAVYQYYYSYVLTETNGAVYPGGVLCTATANAWIALQPPVVMRETPTVVVSAGGFSIRTAAAVTAIGTTTLISGSTAGTLSLTSAAACTATLPYQLVGTNTTGTLTFSAEP